jgi:hypothetical protein
MPPVPQPFEKVYSGWKGNTMNPELKCANCGIVIRWQPTIIEARVYCCLGCARGGPCICDYDNLPHPDEFTPLARKADEEKPG